MIFEIARSEMGYTEQRPAEYAAVMLAAAIREQWQGPFFLQGDHFQTNPKKMKENAAKEIAAIEALIEEAIPAGFLPDRHRHLDARRPLEADPRGAAGRQRDPVRPVHEVHPHARAPRDADLGRRRDRRGRQGELDARGVSRLHGRLQAGPRRRPTGIAKVSVQTGSSHGGMVAADGSVERVAIDFSVLKTISKVAREEYGLAGAVQHGASTLPPEYFGHFPDNDCAEIHLATDFMNTVYEHPAFPLSAQARDRALARRERGRRAQEGRDPAAVPLQDAQEGDRPLQGAGLESARGHQGRDPRDARGEVPVPVHEAARRRHPRPRGEVREAGLRPRRRRGRRGARRLRARRPGGGLTMAGVGTAEKRRPAPGLIPHPAARIRASRPR